MEIRRIRGDLIEVYRILNGLENINPDSLFTRSRYTNIRCHTMKLEKKQVHLDIRKYFFTQRVIDYWNALPQSGIDAENINLFKDQLNIHLYKIIRGLNKPLACCCLPTPMTLASGGSPMFPLVVHQPASPSIWPAVQSLWRGLSTNPGAYVGAVEEMMCVVCVDVTEGA